MSKPPAAPTSKLSVTAVAIEPSFWKVVPATMPTRLAMAPTLRSKSPVTMTMVMAKATTPRMLICRVIFSQLGKVMNVCGRCVQKKSTINTKPTSVP